MKTITPLFFLLLGCGADDSKEDSDSNEYQTDSQPSSEPTSEPSLEPDDESCASNEVEDCFGGCTPQNWLADGECDSALNCSQWNYDQGDCIEDTNECGASNATVFAVNVWNVSTSEDLNGDAWDFPGGLPDPLVCFFIDDEGIGCSNTYDNTTQPSINITTGSISPSVKLSIIFYDEDASDYEFMDGIELDVGDLQDLVNCGSQDHNGPEVDFTFEVLAP